jgi:hypothetical protein
MPAGHGVDCVDDVRLKPDLPQTNTAKKEEQKKRIINAAAHAN